MIFDHSGISVHGVQKQYNLLPDSLGTFQAFNILIKIINKHISLGNLVKINPKGMTVSQIQKIIDLGEKLNVNCYYNQNQEFTNQILKSCNAIDVESIACPIVKNQELYKIVKNLGFSGISAIGDIHGDHDRMYEAVKWAKRNNHFVVLLGDLFNHGNQNFKVLDLAYQLITKSEAVLCRGNHDVQFFHYVVSKKIKHAAPHLSSFVQYKKLSTVEQKRIQNQLFAIINRSNWWWQASNCIFVHAAWSPIFVTNDNDNNKHQRDIERIAMFGFSEKTHEGWVQKHDWINDVPEDKIVIVGHESVSKQFPQERANSKGGRVIFLDTGCSKKGFLSSVDLIFHENQLKFRNFNRF